MVRRYWINEVEAPDGEFVRWDDVRDEIEQQSKHLESLQNRFAQCTAENESLREALALAWEALLAARSRPGSRSAPCRQTLDAVYEALGRKAPVLAETTKDTDELPQIRRLPPVTGHVRAVRKMDLPLGLDDDSESEKVND